MQRGEQDIGAAEGQISTMKEAQDKLLEELDATRARLRETSNLLTALQVCKNKRICFFCTCEDTHRYNSFICPYTVQYLTTTITTTYPTSNLNLNLNLNVFLTSDPNPGDSDNQTKCSHFPKTSSPSRSKTQIGPSIQKQTYIVASGCY